MRSHPVLAALLGTVLFAFAYLADAVLRLDPGPRAALVDRLLDPSLGRDPASAPLSFALFVVPAAALLLATGGKRSRASRPGRG